MIGEEDSMKLRELDEVYTAGFGYFLSIKNPSIYKGYIIRSVNDNDPTFNKPMFITHTARTYTGQSGGALLTLSPYHSRPTFLLLGIIFKNSIIHIKPINSNVKNPIKLFKEL